MMKDLKQKMGEKTMKQNETLNLNLLRVLKMTTTFESNKSFVGTFRRYQLNANIDYIAKSINSKNCRCKPIKIGISLLLK